MYKDNNDDQGFDSRAKTPIYSSKKKKAGKSILGAILIVILLAASAAGYYVWSSNNSATDIDDTQKVAETPVNTTPAASNPTIQTNGTNVAEDPACVEIAPDASTIENIKASITSGNTAALEGYMASSVNVILAATESYGPQTATEAVSDISSFISADSTIWDYDFALPVATTEYYNQGEYGQYFSTISVIGKASNGQVISFSFDCSGKISSVFMSLSDSIL